MYCCCNDALCSVNRADYPRKANKLTTMIGSSHIQSATISFIDYNSIPHITYPFANLRSDASVPSRKQRHRGKRTPIRHGEFRQVTVVCDEVPVNPHHVEYRVENVRYQKEQDLRCCEFLSASEYRADIHRF